MMISGKRVGSETPHFAMTGTRQSTQESYFTRQDETILQRYVSEMQCFLPGGCNSFTGH